MKNPILRSYIMRFTFLATAGIIAVTIIQLQKLMKLPANLWRALS